MASESGNGAGRWQRWRQALLRPGVDETNLEASLEAAVARQPPPVLWLLGKTQAGKTSLIRALTGRDDAEIGSGFRPCTHTSHFYEFPEEAPVVRFLDTRGLGELAYDPGEDIAYCEAHSHLVVAVMKATDVRQDALFEVLASVRRRHPDWPLLMVQTCLHEGYPEDAEHVVPYPFDDEDWAQKVPCELARCLRAQRERLSGLPGRGEVLWVPVDLTLEEDGFEPVSYGLDALWRAIEAASSLGLQAMLRADPGIRDTYARAAHPHIMGYTAAAAGLGAVPVVDLAAVPTLQLKLLHTLAAIYRQRWDAQRSREFFGLLGAGVMAGYGLRWAGRGLAKLVPVWGQTLGAAWGASTSAAVTFALGKAACQYLARKSEGLTPDAEALRRAYAEALEQAGALAAVKQGSSAS